MKKRWIPFIALTLIVIFLGGILFGSATEAGRQSGWVARINVQNTIAIVNSDIGVVDEEENRLNYSAAIIQALEDEFVQASPALAETGFLDGTFGAIVTFPYNASERVLSFNDRYPQRIQLEFIINPYLTEREYVETYIRILNLQMAINSTLAHTYVNSIFGQLHTAQNQVTGIFENKNRDMTAMDIIALEQFTPSLELEYIPEIPFEPESFDGSGHFTTHDGFAYAVSLLYRENYSQASSSFLAMREGVFITTEHIPEQANEWLEELEVWAGGWEEYRAALEVYKDDITAVIGDLEQLMEDLDDYIFDLEGRVTDADTYLTGLSNWHDRLESNFGILNNFFESTLVEGIDDFNANRDVKGDFEVDLRSWREDLVPRYNTVTNWSANLSWYIELINFKQDAVDQINAAINQRPTNPDAPSYQEAVGLWYVEVVNASVNALNDLVSHMQQHFGGSLPQDIFAPLNRPSYQKPVIFGALPTTVLGLDWDSEIENVLSADPFVRVLPDPISPFEEPVPEENAPTSEEGFLNPLNDMRGQIEVFEVEAYMTDYLWQEVEGHTRGVGSYIDSVGMELGTHVGVNYSLLNRIHAEYISYLTRVRQAAIDTEASGITNLHERLARFHDVHDVTRLDTIGRLIDFSDMMPESRTEDGINMAMVEHTVMPLEFTPPILREEQVADLFGEESIYNRFGRFLWVGISLLILAFLITLSSYIVSHKRRKKI